MKYLDLTKLDPSYITTDWFQTNVKRCYEHQWAGYLVNIPKELFYESFSLPGKEQLYEDITAAGNNFELAYAYLQKYSLPYLSEVVIHGKTPEQQVRDYKELIDKYNLVLQAKSRLDPQWYCIVHGCFQVNALLAMPLAKSLFPDQDFYYYDTGYHGVVINAPPEVVMDAIRRRDKSFFDSDNEYIAVDFYWSFIDRPLSMMFFDTWSQKYNWDVNLQYTNSLEEAVNIITEGEYLCSRYNI